MKRTLILLCLTFTSVAFADFLDAGEAYEQKDYLTALKEYQALAELGHHESQHNLAVMHFLGQGTEKNPVQAYAWAGLAKAGDDPKLHGLQDKIKSNLNSEQFAEAQQRFQILHEHYGSKVITQRWEPPAIKTNQAITQANNNDSHTTDYTITPLKRKAPRYPKSALKKGIQGWVKVTFEIHPDGSIRRPVVVDSFPQNTFDKATLNAIRGFKFNVDYNLDVEPYPVCATQTITYQMGDQIRYEKGYEKRIEKLQQLANENHPDAHYYLAMAMDGKSPIPETTTWERSQLLINRHLFKAAQSGHIDAQYQLGNNLYSGVGGYQQREKGIRWLILAAENRQPQAARRLSQIFKANPDINPTEHPAHYWLVQAADQGDFDAQLSYAEWLADNSNDPAQISHALTLLDNYADERPETVIWYQTAATLHSKSGDDSQAKKYLKKADRLAKRLGWEN